jgi:hypothetical protein
MIHGKRKLALFVLAAAVPSCFVNAFTPPSSNNRIHVRRPSPRLPTASLESPLFRTSSLATRDIELQTRPQTSWKRRFPAVALSIWTVLSACTRQVMAIQQQQPHLTISIPKHMIRLAVKVIALWLIITSLIRQVQVKRRQRLDATSEWGRYAAHPGARGRAVLCLILKILPFWLFGKLWRTHQHSLRIRSGTLFSTGLLQLGPLYIKLGQIVSCREGLLPEEWKKELERLQDKVPARSGREALELAYASIGSQQEFEATFSNFTTTPLVRHGYCLVWTSVLFMLCSFSNTRYTLICRRLLAWDRSIKPYCERTTTLSQSRFNDPIYEKFTIKILSFF